MYNQNQNRNQNQPPSNELHIIQWNARSIAPKIDDLDVTAGTLNPHIIAIQETFLKPNLESPKLYG